MLGQRTFEQLEVQPGHVLSHVDQAIVRIVSRNTSASPHAKSKSTSATVLAGLAARIQPRFTATLVQPTPPDAPATAIMREFRLLPSEPPNLAWLMRPRAPINSSRLTGSVRNSFAPARMAFRMRWPSLLLLTASKTQSGASVASFPSDRWLYPDRHPSRSHRRPDWTGPLHREKFIA